jgi:dolichyl-phosphate beta-glucosyltransferase
MNLSIIIPVWNEAAKIAPDIQRIDAWLSANQIRGEIIISDDGSTDQTPAIAESHKISPQNSLIILRHLAHRGKGFVTRRGMLASTAPYILFMDCGGNVPLDFIATGLDLIKSRNCDLAIGSRYLSGSRIRQAMIWYRRIYSQLFRRLIKTMLHFTNPVSDTQCGFKLYRGEVARRLYSECTLDGFLFDVEIILLAQKYGFEIIEFPIVWSSDRDTRLKVGNTIIPVLRQIFALRRRFRT